jgi:neprosin-like protein
MSKDRNNKSSRISFTSLFARLWRVRGALCAVLAGILLFGSCKRHEEPKPQNAMSFDGFISGVRTAKFEDYSTRQGAQVANAEEFEKMRKHLLSLYEGVKPEHTFAGTNDQFVDCIPREQQPGLRNPKTGVLKLVTEGPQYVLKEEPKTTTPDRKTPKDRQIADLTLKPGVLDRFGMEKFCKEGTVPLRRITLDEMTRFRTLRDFLSKGGHPFVRWPQNHGDRPGLDVPGDASHYYSAAFQNVSNIGGDSWLNLWSPTVSSNRMSLSQIWVSGGSGDGTQTVEVGWQVYPSKWGGNNAALFIFYTPNNYDDGCYNVECSGFVQVANNIYLGSGFDHYSARDGGQWGFNIQVQRNTDGNWWLFYRGPGNYIPFGYYPGSLYGSGQLSRNAERIGWGGEDTGDPSALQEGSGAFPTEGWGRAAYHDVVFYIDTNRTSQWTELFKVETPSDCYKTDISNAASNHQKTFFYFGGPSCH